MSYETTKLLSLLAYPLSQSLLLLLLALLLLWLRRGRGAGLLMLVALSWLYLCSTAWFADLTMARLEAAQAPRAVNAVPPMEAIVVLGGATRGDVHMGSLGDLSAQADRLVTAAALYKAGKAPLVLVSGGADPGARPEAELMEEILAVMGVPGRAIIQEPASRDTRQNADYSAQVLRNQGVRRVLLVTSAFHMRRATAVFSRTGLEVYPVPTDYQRLVSAPGVPRWLPTVDDLQRTTMALREEVGYWYYVARGWI